MIAPIVLGKKLLASKVGAFIKRDPLQLISLVVIVVLLGQNALLRRDVDALKERLRTSLVSPTIATLPSPAQGDDKIVVTRDVKIKVPGPPGKTVTVTVDKVIIRDGERTGERIGVEAPPVFCLTQAECDKIYLSAEQRFKINVSLVAGTVLPMLVNGEVKNLSLARDVPFTLFTVMLERGVMAGLNVPGTGLRIDTIRSETIVATAAPTVPRSLPHLTLHPFKVDISGSPIQGFVAHMLQYENWLGAGVYRLAGQYNSVVVNGNGPRWRVELSWGIPLGF